RVFHNRSNELLRCVPGFLVVGYGDCFRGGLLVLCAKLRRTGLDGQLVDRALEREWRQIILVVHSCAGIHTDIEGLVNYLLESNRVFLLSGSDLLSVYLEDTSAALGDAGAIIGIIEHDGVLARGERLLTFPAVLREREHIVVEHRLAFEQVESIS